MESSSHLLLHCQKVWKLWCSILDREGVSWCCLSQLQFLMQEWSSLNAKFDYALWDMIPYALIWSVWLARNELVFNNKAFEMNLVWDLHISRLAWWVKVGWKDCPYSTIDFLQNFGEIRVQVNQKRIRKNEWSAPPIGVLKFNVDGSALGAPGRSGVGGVLKNSNRQVIGIFSKAIGELWAYEAEVKTILQALIFCQQHHLKHILIESDSTLAVGWVSKQANRPWRLIQGNLIDALCVEIDCLGIKHIFRESNSSADYLAKSGVHKEINLWSFFGLQN